MNKNQVRVTLYVAAVAALMGLVLWPWHRTSAPRARSLPVVALQSASASPSVGTPAQDEMSPPQFAATQQEEKERERKIWESGLATPIRFYGKVLDEKGHSIEGASVRISLHDHIGGGNTKEQKLTDSNGLFSVSGRGLGLGVMVSKEGYYHLQQSDGTFGYANGAGTGAAHPNPAGPAIFVLRKMGTAEPLVRIADKDVQLPTNGTPVEFDLVGGKTVRLGDGDIRIEAWVNGEAGANEPYDWHCRISVPKGGLIERTDEFAFQAPDTGYRLLDEIEMPSSLGSRWRSQLSKKYFLRLADGNYTRVDLTITLGAEHFFTVSAFLNPSGSRNLEYDPAKEIKAK